MSWLNNFGESMQGIGSSIGQSVRDIGSAVKMTYDNARAPKPLRKIQPTERNSVPFKGSDSLPIESLRDTRAAQNPTGFMGAMKRNQDALNAPSYKKGGRIPKTGLYKLHKDEEVIPAKKADMARKMGYGGDDMSILKDIYKSTFGRSMPKHLQKEKLNS